MPEPSSPPPSQASRSKHKVMNIEKKRQTDRESQRVVRERTKKYISHLENLVDTLQKCQRDERLQSMALHCKELHDENERLRSSITCIGRIVRGVEMPEGSESTSTRPADQPLEAQKLRAGSFTYLNGSPYGALFPKEQTQNPSPMSTHNQGPIPVPFVHSTSLKIPSPNSPAEHLPSDHQSALPSKGGSPATRISDRSHSISANGDESTVFAMINNRLGKADGTKLEIKTDEDADIAIRAVAYGWPLVEQRYELDPAWGIVRQIDQEIFFCCGPIERLGILRVIRLKLLQQMTTSNRQEIQALTPPYMHSSPLQEFVEHPRIIDYFVWPELREFLILNTGKAEASNQIAAVFVSSLRFLWPFDLGDAWTRNRHTGLYSYSQLFNEYFNDVRSWSLTQDFFELYPSLCGYVPC
ncbi:hypothetical protein BKA65DRAFT_507981 [Rhexocercosporidium sp. MPI-PUGE-AT-0058]|nr:hypothetical protein BKA65DRAFT_507981 [Rhexocercosporidium sp. MPI-PUGE-AT-0058]